MKYDAVVFDFYGTLAEAVDWGPTIEDVFESHGFELPREAVDWWSSIDGIDHSPHSASRATYLAWERDRLRALVVRSGVHEEDTEHLVDDLHAAVKTYELRVYDDARAVLRELTATSLRLAVCSNWDWDLHDRLGELDLDGVFPVVVASARVGARKPHPRIYRHTLRDLDTTPDRVLFAGDSWVPDIEGPISFGMTAVHVARHLDQRDTPRLPRGALRVSSLEQLLPCVL